MNKGKKVKKIAHAKKEFKPEDYVTKNISLDEVKEIREVFTLFDKDKDDKITTSELKLALENLGIDAKNQTLQSMINDMDKDSNGIIDFKEFVNMMTSNISDSDTREDLKKVFEMFIGEDDEADKIELKHLKRIAKELNGTLTISQQKVDSFDNLLKSLGL